MKAARVLNIAMDMMVEEAHGVDAQLQLVRELTGPYRTMGKFSEDPELRGAPAWWHGEEEAYESTMSAMQRAPRRGRTRRR